MRYVLSLVSAPVNVSTTVLTELDFSFCASNIMLGAIVFHLSRPISLLSFSSNSLLNSLMNYTKITFKFNLTNSSNSNAGICLYGALPTTQVTVCDSAGQNNTMQGKCKCGNPSSPILPIITIQD